MRKNYLAKAAQNGRPLQDKAPYMTMSDLRELTLRLFARDEVKALKGRTLLAMQWGFIARSSDISDVEFSQLQMTGEYLLVRVVRKKTRQEHTVAVFPAALQCEFDLLHALAAQLTADRFVSPIASSARLISTSHTRIIHLPV